MFNLYISGFCFVQDDREGFWCFSCTTRLPYHFFQGINLLLFLEAVLRPCGLRETQVKCMKSAVSRSSIDRLESKIPAEEPGRVWWNVKAVIIWWKDKCPNLFLIHRVFVSFMCVQICPLFAAVFMAHVRNCVSLNSFRLNSSKGFSSYSPHSQFSAPPCRCFAFSHVFSPSQWVTSPSWLISADGGLGWNQRYEEETGPTHCLAPAVS